MNWSINDLATHSGQTASNIKKFESGRPVSENARQAMIDTLEKNLLLPEPFAPTK